ncbi:hypothetical protein SLEP1_g30383 [Rubroshorea leprosula]|uniref:Uncharacterized protein n=1 Tax=Rubroshorea leprosula TaxID=152421 RepID=A0AAV5K6J7_9ROSI|nr:hypothetical protein SLEP1_g30383 [Rubroshorea leprosula]
MINQRSHQGIFNFKTGCSDLNLDSLNIVSSVHPSSVPISKD